MYGGAWSRQSSTIDRRFIVNEIVINEQTEYETEIKNYYKIEIHKLSL